MRALWLLGLFAPAVAHAEVTVGGQVGAGAQGATTYSAVELRLDAQWTRAHVGLGMRGVWDDAEFRGSEWASPWAALTIVRDAVIHGTLGEVELAAAAGALSPAHVGRVVDGYRVALDDRWRTGVRLAAHAPEVDAGAEIDDVLEPRLIAGGVTWLVGEPWGVHVQGAVDPGIGEQAFAAAAEAGAFRRIADDGLRLDLGVSMIVEPAPTGVMFADLAIDGAGARWTARGDVRVGSGGLFGPLYRVEGIDDETGLGAGLAGGAASERGWFELGARRRPGLGGLYTASAGAPMGRWIQAAAWTAIAHDAAAGAAELRVVWTTRLFSAVRGARMYRLDATDVGAMAPAPVWSITAWFGAASL